MTYPADQTARLQTLVDSLPECLFAEDMADVTKKLAGTFRQAGSGEYLATQCNALELVGNRLQTEGGDGPNAAHGGISGLYCKGSDGYTDFLRAYAGAYRASDDVVEAELRGNWAGKTVAATKSFFRDLGEGAEGLVKGVGESGAQVLLDAFKGLWPIFALIGALIIGIIIVAVVTKGKISLK